MLLRCCLIHIATIILRHILCLVYLCPWLGLSIFMSYLCDRIFIFSLIFIAINHTYLFFVHFLEYLPLCLDDNVVEKSDKFSNSKSSASGCSLAFVWFFCQFQPGVTHKLMKVLLIKMSVTQRTGRSRVFYRTATPKHFTKSIGKNYAVFC